MAAEQADSPAGTVALEVEWSNPPFRYGTGDGPAWPFPLIRPYPYPAGGDPDMHDGPVELPAELVARYRAAEQAYLDVQDELRDRAVSAGVVPAGEVRAGGGDRA